MANRYCPCGRPIVVRYLDRRTGVGRFMVPQDDGHDLCSKCYKAERDRNRLDYREDTSYSGSVPPVE